ncbi:transmembrane KIAA1109-like, partial [Paramuricea clavata]
SPTSTDEPDAPNTPGEGESAGNISQRKKVRQFRSKSWKLEPTVRFLSWAGRRMEGVNIDWVLEKLGFEHARLTIPKWVQRGAMDPMDRFLSVLLYRLLLAVQENEA